MKKSILFLFFSCCLCVFSNAAPIVKPAPTNEQVAQLADKLMAIKNSKMEPKQKEVDIQKEIKAAETLFNFEKLSLEQIQNYLLKGGLAYGSNHVRKAIYTALYNLSQANDLDGVKAASILTVNYPMAENGNQKDYEQNLKWAEFYKYFAHHPAIDSFMLINDFDASSIFGRLQFLNEQAIAKTGLIYDLMPLLDKEMSARVVGSVFLVFKIGASEKVGLQQKTIQTIRQSCVDAIDRYLAKGETPDENLINRKTYMEGASARNVLIGYEAPELKIDWLNSGKEKSLTDFKGKVVILDFWAVWCSPCIASFPNVKKLQERYAGYPVEIIGITSLQGYNYEMTKEGKKTINAKNNPALEYSLMPQFMKHYDMTWKVAYTTKRQFNPDFGVTGIPHVAIVDAKGIVRYNDLRPYHAPYLEAEKIDALLKEAGLPFPKEPMSKVNFSSVED